MQFSTGFGRPSGGGFFGSYGGLKAPEPINSRAEDYKSPGDNSSPAGQTIPAGIGTSSYDMKIVWWSGFKVKEGKVTASFVALLQDCIFTDSFSLVKLFADERAIISNVAPLKQTSQKVRFYDGSQVTPDPLLVSKLGADKASAWPGFVYAVFEDFDCTDYGNRVPLIRAVLSGSVTSVAATEEPSQITFEDWATFDPNYSDPFHAAESKSTAADYQKGQVYIVLHPRLVTGTPETLGWVSVVDMRTNIEISRSALFDRTGSGWRRFEPITALQGSDYFVVADDDMSSIPQHETPMKLLLVNAMTGEIVTRSAPWTGESSITVIKSVLIESGAATKYAVFCEFWGEEGPTKSGLGIALVDITDGAISWIMTPFSSPVGGTFTRVVSLALGPVESGQATFFWTAQQRDQYLLNGFKAEVRKGIVDASGVTESVIYTEAESGKYPQGVAYDATDDNIVILRQDGSIRKVTQAGATVYTAAAQAILDLGLNLNWDITNFVYDYVARPGTAFAGRESTGDIYTIDLSDGSLSLYFDVDNATYAGWSFVFHIDQLSGWAAEYIAGDFPGQIVKITLGDMSPNSVGLVDIITQIYEAAGIPSGDLAFSDVTDSGVYGLKLENDTTYENLRDSVVEPFDIKCVESDGVNKIKGPRRDGALTIDAVIAPELLVENGTTTIEKSFGAREDEFAGCTVSYFDRDADYKKLDQEYNRPLGVYDVTRSRKKRTINTVLSLTASQAMQLATLAVYRSVLGNESYTLGFTPPLSHLEPGDIVQYDFRGFTTVARIAEASFGADYTQDVQAYQYLQYADATFTGAALDSAADDDVSASARLLVLDLPLLSPAHDLAGAGLVNYALPVGYGTAELGAASLYHSLDSGSTYTLIGSRSGIAPVTGIVTAISGTPADPFVKDTANTIAVRVTSGDIADLATITDSEFEAGVNLAAIGRNGRWVLVWFQTVAASSGTATLSDLMWGVRGSEVWIGSLQVGDQFVLLKSDQYIRFREAVAELDETLHYKLAYRTIPLGASPTVAYVAAGVAETPYASVNLAAEVVGSDIVLDWDYRSRVASGLNPSNHGEASLSFEIDIMDGATVKRTLTSTTNSKTYLAADITTDFGSIPASLTFRVYMMSAVVGRGYRAEATVPLSGFSTADSTIITADNTSITADTA